MTCYQKGGHVKGWIKFHRKTLDNPIVMKDSAHFAVWSYLLLNATHTELPAMFKGKRIVLQPGQLITGCISISDKLKLNESKVRRVLNDFQNDGQIDRQTSNKNSLISILNWEMYQKSDEQNAIQNDKQVTDNRRTEKEKVTTNKNVFIQELKNERKDYIMTDSKESVRQTEKVSDVPALTESEALSAANDVSEKRGFPENLKNAFNRWVTYKYDRGDSFKNYYAVDKVGQAVESYSKDYTGRVDERHTDLVIKLIDCCISAKTKSICWTQIHNI